MEGDTLEIKTYSELAACIIARCTNYFINETETDHGDGYAKLLFTLERAIKGFCSGEGKSGSCKCSPVEGGGSKAGLQDGDGLFVIQYQYLQRDFWYDEPMGYCQSIKEAQQKLCSTPFEDAKKRGVLYRMIKREKFEIDVVVES